MIARRAVVHRVTHRLDTERNQTAAHPAPTAQTAQAAEPLRLRSFTFDISWTSVLAHRAVNALRLVMLLQVLPVVVVLLGLDEFGCHHHHLHGRARLLGCLAHVLGLLLLLLLRKAIGRLVLK